MTKPSKAAVEAAEDLRLVLESLAGRRVLWRLLVNCGIYGACFQGDGEPWTCYREGRRSIGIELIPEMEAAAPGVYAQMGREAAESKAAAKRASRRAKDEPADEGM